MWWWWLIEVRQNCKAVQNLLEKVGFALILGIVGSIISYRERTIYLHMATISPTGAPQGLADNPPLWNQTSTTHQWWWCQSISVQDRGRPEKYWIRDMWFLSTLSFNTLKSLWSRVFCWQAIMSLSCVKQIVIPASSKHLHVQLNVFTTCWCRQMLHVGITWYQEYTSQYW